MSADSAGDFASYLATRNHIADAFGSRSRSESRDGQNALRKIWESTDLTANDFADEVARFYRLARVSLPQLLAATALVKHFSPRFLREMMVFPYQSADRQLRVAVADPTDTACLRAAEITLGGPVTIEVASFEDIATALDERLGDEDASSPEGGETTPARAADDIDSLRDLASGAPVVGAVNDLLEKAAELRPSDTHIGPFRSGLVMPMRVQALLRTA